MSDIKVEIRDTLRPALARAIRACARPREVLEAIGAALVSVTVRAFRDPSLRPSEWPPTKKGAATLYEHGALKHSIRVVSTTNTSVTVGTDRPYAIYHQLGTKPYTIRPKTKAALFWKGANHPVKLVNHPGLPARPFFPFTAEGRITDAGMRRLEAAGRAALARMIGAK